MILIVVVIFQITSQSGNKYVYVLKATAELWSNSMKTRTQIVFTLDASVIIFHLFVRPGSRVVESGISIMSWFIYRYWLWCSLYKFCKSNCSIWAFIHI